MGQASLYKHRAPPAGLQDWWHNGHGTGRKEVYLLGVVDKEAQRENLVQIEGKVMTIVVSTMCLTWSHDDGVGLARDCMCACLNYLLSTC